MAILKKIWNIASTVLEVLIVLCAVFLWILLGIIAVPILLGLIVGFCVFISDFPSELRYLNNEIQRAEGTKRRHWIRRRRRLWLSLIPFVKY